METGKLFHSERSETEVMEFGLHITSAFRLRVGAVGGIHWSSLGEHQRVRNILWSFPLCKDAVSENKSLKTNRIALVYGKCSSPRMEGGLSKLNFMLQLS